MSDSRPSPPATSSIEGEAGNGPPSVPLPPAPPHSVLKALYAGLKDAGSFGGWAWRFFHDKAPGAGEPGTPPEPEGPPGGGQWLKSVLLALRPAYRQALLLSFFINLIALAGSVFSLQVYERVVAHAGLSSLAALVIGMAIATVIDQYFRAGRAELMQRMGLKIDAKIARQAFERMLARS